MMCPNRENQSCLRAALVFLAIKRAPSPVALLTERFQASLQ